MHVSRHHGVPIEAAILRDHSPRTNEELILEGEDPIAFDHDCREGICGTCGIVIDGHPRRPLPATTTCQLHMRLFKGGDTITVEPWQAGAFPIIKDLVVERRPLDRIVATGGYISVSTGSAPEANAIPIPKQTAEMAMDAASCIGCGACVAACPNASAMLFTAAKVAHPGLLPQGQPERYDRVLHMVTAMDDEMFGACTNTGEYEAVCPKEISIEWIARINRNHVLATMLSRPNTG